MNLNLASVMCILNLLGLTAALTGCGKSDVRGQNNVAQQSHSSASKTNPVSTPSFIITSKPNPRYATGVFGVYTSDTRQPLLIAKLAERSHETAEKFRWKRVQIFVFNDRAAANSFQDFQALRRNAILTIPELEENSKIWRNTRLYYDRIGREKVLYPFKNPNGWWRGMPPPKPLFSGMPF